MPPNVGELVVCDCLNNSEWYKGKPGLLIAYDKFGHRQATYEPGCSAVVQYGSRVVRLVPSGLTKLDKKTEKTP